jgi:PAS domain S-box-containing protein
MSAKIMVVDDNSATRRMVRIALQRNGHDVIEAEDGRSARALMASEHPQLVLQDLMLPDADGFELVGELRKLAGPHVSILAFSGFVSKLDEARVSSVGFDDIITKPIAPSRLVPLVEAHLPATIPTNDRFGIGRRLVVVDDDPLQLKLASFRLARLGFEVESAPDGAVALELIRRRKPDAVVSDVMMPELDGFGLAIALRRDPALEDLPLVLVTSSYIEPSDRELARRSGANELVLRTPELAEVIEQLRVTLADETEIPVLPAESLPELERERTRRIVRQLERQVMLNTGLARRCSALASELTVLNGIADTVLRSRDVDAALDEALASCFDAGGVAAGALYLVEPGRTMRVRTVGADPRWTAEELAGFFGQEALLENTITSGTALYMPSDAVSASVSSDVLGRCNGSALLLVPLTSASGPLGALLMVSRDRDHDAADWRTFAVGVGTQLSQVLTLARAYSDREAAERDAAHHAALLEAVVESAPDYVMQLGLDYEIQFVNRVRPPRKPQDYIGTSWFEHLPSDQHATARAALDTVIRTGEAIGFEMQIVRPDGTTSWFQNRLGPIRQRGAIVGCVLVARDVSDKKQTEMQLMLADRMASVGTLAAGVAHEINNPLASVIANLDMAIQDVHDFGKSTKLPAELVDELADARSSADRVREIVRDLKIFSRSQEDQRGAVDVEKVLDSTLRMAWNELRHRARIVKAFTKVPRVEANESRIGQVFLNLIVNAAQAIPEGNYENNQIRVSTALEGDRVVVRITDTGPGIPVAARPRMFTPFFTTKPVGVGTGLGLAISHRIVTGLGGTITFDTTLGKGTEFRVALPLAIGAAPVTTQEVPVARPAKRRGRVLVIDDEEILAHALRRYLSAEHDVVAMTSGRAALDLLLGGQRFDVILCDLMMPQVTGMELHAEVLRMDPAQGARIVFLTGGAFTVAARAFLDTIPNQRLEKPFDLKILTHVVNQLVV